MSDNPFDAPEATQLPAPTLPIAGHPTVRLLRRLIWTTVAGWIAIMVASAVLAMSEPDAWAETPAEVEDSDEPLVVSEPAMGVVDNEAIIGLIVLALTIAWAWTMVRLYRLRRGANLQALILTLISYPLMLLIDGEAPTEPAWLDHLASLADLAWGGALALSFVAPLRAHFAGSIAPYEAALA